MSDLAASALGVVLASVVFIGAVFSTVRLAKRRRLPPIVAASVMALASASSPWIIKASGGVWSFDGAVWFSAIVGGMMFVGAFRLFRDLASRDIPEP